MLLLHGKNTHSIDAKMRQKVESRKFKDILF